MTKTVAVVFALCFHGTLAYPQGAPCSQLDLMTPKHRGGRFEANPPYSIELTSTCYQPGIAITGKTAVSRAVSTITVTLKPVGTETKLKGFVLQSRAACQRAEKVERLGG